MADKVLAPVQEANYRRVRRWPRFVIGVLVLGVVGSFLYFDVAEFFTPKTEIYVEFSPREDLHGLGNRSWFVLDGTRAGTVTRIEHSLEGKTVVVELYPDEEVERRARLSGNEVRIDFTRAHRIQVKGVEQLRSGTTLVMVSTRSPATATFQDRFQGEPRNFVKVVFASGVDMNNVVVGTPLEIDGDEVGEVIAIDRETESFSRTAVVRLIDDQAVLTRARRGENRVTLEYSRAHRIELQNVERLVTGPSLVMKLGPATAEYCDVFALASEVLNIDFGPSQDLHGLVVGSRFEFVGDNCGEVIEIQRRASGVRRLVVRLLDDPTLHAATRRSSNKVYVDYTRVKRLRTFGEGRLVAGSALVMVPGAEEGEETDTFSIQPGLPPDPRLSPQSISIIVRCRDVYGLEAPADFRVNGKVEGIVERLHRESDSQMIAAHVRLFETNPEKCRIARASTRVWVNLAQLSFRGIEGQDASTLLMGPHLYALVDPLAPADEEFESNLVAEIGQPPMLLPHPNEREIRLVSDYWVEPDSLVTYHDSVAGYVHSSSWASDGGSVFVNVRVYPRAQGLITTKSVFFKAQSVRMKQFKKNGGVNPLDWEPPEIHLAELHQMIRRLDRTEIEFRTPLDGGRLVDFEGENLPRFSLHDEPEASWLTWKPTTRQVLSKKDGALPTVYGTTLKFRPPRGTFSIRQPDWQEVEGLAIATEKGLLGLKRLLQPTLPEEKIGSSEFYIDEKLFTRGAVRSVSSDLGLMSLKVDTQLAWPKEKFVSLTEPVDCVLVIRGGRGRAIDAERLTVQQDTWEIDRKGFFYRPAWNGCPVVCTEEGEHKGKVIGILEITESSLRIHRIPQDF